VRREDDSSKKGDDVDIKEKQVCKSKTVKKRGKE
jgi:hypothetical protein